MTTVRNPNSCDSRDDTFRVTSDGGDNGVYEFDQEANFLGTILSADPGYL